MSNSFPQSLREEISKLERTLEQNIEFVKYRELVKVLSVYDRGSEVTSPADSDGTGELKATELRQSDDVTVRVGRRQSPERERILDESKSYVRGRHTPTPVREIFDHLKSIGITVPGESPLNNLSAMLSNSDYFESVGRMGWRLLDDDDRAVIDTALQAAAGSYIENISQDSISSAYNYWEEYEKIPSDIDGRLLATARSIIRRDLSERERDLLRIKFIEHARLLS